jgi:pimeloyl-ACP methyl ester carboxylesterase
VADRNEIPVQIASGGVVLEGDLGLVDGARAIVLFAHGSGSSRHSTRNRMVALSLQRAGLSTLLMDLLTAREEASEAGTGQLRFDIALLAERLVGAADWLAEEARTRDLALGCFGASTGAAAALVAAAMRPERIGAVVSRGGRPDLAESALETVRAPTLLIVGGNDHGVIEVNEDALARLGSQDRAMRIVPGATHLFEEPGALDEVARLAGQWFRGHLVVTRAAASRAETPNARAR